MTLGNLESGFQDRSGGSAASGAWDTWGTRVSLERSSPEGEGRSGIAFGREASIGENA